MRARGSGCATTAREQGAAPRHHAMAAGAPLREVGSGWGKDTRGGGEAAPSGRHDCTPARRAAMAVRRGRIELGTGAAPRTGESGTGPSHVRHGCGELGRGKPGRTRHAAGRGGGRAS
jgi:hypothetical protein